MREGQGLKPRMLCTHVVTFFHVYRSFHLQHTCKTHVFVAPKETFYVSFYVLPHKVSSPWVQQGARDTMLPSLLVCCY